MFAYFGYGSNLDRAALRAKDVEPIVSTRGVLRGWRLRFNVAHFFRHEGGVANIERTGDPADRVLGVVHRLESAALARLDAAEAYPDGYDRIIVAVETDLGTVDTVTYVGTPDFVDDSCLPSRRYLTIVVRGAQAAGLDEEYVERLRGHPVLVPSTDPPFVHPAGDHPVFTAATLARHPTYTALDDAVFDMARARKQHQLLVGLYGGRDMTSHHLRRLDTSDGADTTVPAAARTAAQRAYLDAYLRGYDEEYEYVGRLVAEH
jgi:sulfite reductase (NADPH) flavoprotein alpha-component